MIERNRTGFNPATLAVIDSLSGDQRTGRCLCPCHDDGRNPSLEVFDGDKVNIVVHCHWINKTEHNLEVIAYLRQNGVWPTSDALSHEKLSERAEQNRSPEHRRPYAISIWNSLRSTPFLSLLQICLNARAIKKCRQWRASPYPWRTCDARGRIKWRRTILVWYCQCGTKRGGCRAFTSFG